MELKPGQVFKLYCATCVKQKNKFFVAALIEPVLRCFLINSKMTELQIAKDDLAFECIELSKDKHPFLDHDSYLGCNQLFVEYTAKALCQIVHGSPGRFVGCLDRGVMDEALSRFPKNISLPQKRIRELIEAWKSPA
ncbi:hypothetical protein ISN75_22735 [Dyella marensis]|uniref:hypothetical protein n=1 Tax=Dyella marensis TaxID=500610 RepID=UPI0031D50C86